MMKEIFFKSYNKYMNTVSRHEPRLRYVTTWQETITNVGIYFQLAYKGQTQVTEFSDNNREIYGEQLNDCD